MSSALISTAQPLGNLFDLVPSALSADEVAGPLAMSRLLHGLAPHLSRVVNPVIAGLRLCKIDRAELLQTVQVGIASALDTCEATTPDEFWVWLSAQAFYALADLRSELLQRQREARAVARLRRGPVHVGGPELARMDSVLPRQRHSLRIVLRALSDDERHVLKLRSETGASWRSVAEALGVSKATARRRHARALARARAVAKSVNAGVAA